MNSSIQVKARQLWDIRCAGGMGVAEAVQLIALLEEHGSPSFPEWHPLKIHPYGGKDYREVLLNNGLFKEAHSALWAACNSGFSDGSVQRMHAVRIKSRECGQRLWDTTRGVIEQIEERFRTPWCGRSLEEVIVR